MCEVLRGQDDNNESRRIDRLRDCGIVLKVFFGDKSTLQSHNKLTVHDVAEGSNNEVHVLQSEVRELAALRIEFLRERVDLLATHIEPVIVQVASWVLEITVKWECWNSVSSAQVSVTFLQPVLRHIAISKNSTRVVEVGGR